ncbi:MAG: ABC transporter permease subunit [Candidatus Riflebacteria bacterium]|nr:ABC transporter permease subunit [Candidatus Riflebacteria bacterium]
MTPILAIALRELYSFVVSLRAYVILGLGLALFTHFFGLLLADGREASMRSMFKIMEFLFLTICPILTMGALAEERRSGTLELLRTAPVSRTGIVLGKYLGLMTVFAMLVAATFHFYAVLEYYGAPDRWPVVAGYVGLMLEGGLLLAIGLLASSLTSSQAVSGLLTYAAAFGLYALALIGPYLPDGWGTAVTSFGLGAHMNSMARGLIETQDLVYFATLTPLALALTVWHQSSRE